MSLISVAPLDEPVQWSVIRARGEDAVSFLQGQLSGDLSSLTTTREVASLLLAPTGDVITSVSCLAADGGVDLLMRSESVEVALSALRRFLLRTHCTFDSEPGVAGPYATMGEQVLLGVPGPAEFARGLAAHSFGPDFVTNHVSFTKGCFTGQELVGRLDARGGNVPYRLVRLTGEDARHLDEVARARGPQGERALQGLTTVVRDTQVRALAVVHRTFLDDKMTLVTDGVLVEMLPDAQPVRR